MKDEQKDSTEMVESKSSSKNIVPETNVNFNAETLIAQAIEKGLPVENMERLLVMRKELKKEWAKEQYDKAMTKFQSECPTIQKTKEVLTNGGKVAYRYAPLESIVEQVKKVLQEHGFAYSSSMELIEEGTTKVKVAIKVTHESGHSEINEMTTTLGNKTAMMSDSQVIAAASTFAKRYAFCNAFGILTGDDDNDAQGTDGNTAQKPQLPPKTTSSANASVSTPKMPAATTAPNTDPNKPSKAQLEFIDKLMEEKGIDGAKINAWGFIGATLTRTKATLLIDMLRSQPKKESQALPVINVDDEKITVEDIPA